MAISSTTSTLLELLEFPAALIGNDGIVWKTNSTWVSQIKIPPGADFLTACRQQTTPYLAHSSEVAYAVESILHHKIDKLILPIRPRESDVPIVLTIKKHESPNGLQVAILHGDMSQTSEKIRQTIKDQALKAAEALARGFAAEMNNILGAVTGFTEMAREGLPDDAPAKDDLNEVMRLLRRAASLTYSMLAFGRSECLPRQSISFVPAVREALQRILPSLPDHVRIRADSLPNKDFNVLISQAQLLQIFRKLFQNTWEATENNITLNISITYYEKDPPKNNKEYTEKCVVLSVNDNGPGMDQATCEKIFDPLFTTKPMSAGMGLTLIQGIITSLGGNVQVTSTPGQGTRFDILFPVLDDASPSMHKSIMGGSRHSLPKRSSSLPSLYDRVDP